MANTFTQGVRSGKQMFISLDSQNEPALDTSEAAAVTKQVRALGYVTPEMFSITGVVDGVNNNFAGIKAAIEWARANKVKQVRLTAPVYVMNNVASNKLTNMICGNDVTLVSNGGSTVKFSYHKVPLFYYYKNKGAAGASGVKFIYTGTTQSNSTADYDTRQYAQAIGVAGATGTNPLLLAGGSYELFTVFDVTSSDNVVVQRCSLASDTIGQGVTLGTSFFYSARGWYDNIYSATQIDAGWKQGEGNKVLDCDVYDCLMPILITGQLGFETRITAGRRYGIADIAPGHVVYSSGYNATNSGQKVWNTACKLVVDEIDNGIGRGAGNLATLALKWIRDSIIQAKSKHWNGLIQSFGGEVDNNDIDGIWSYEGTDNNPTTSGAGIINPGTSSGEPLTNNRMKFVVRNPISFNYCAFGSGLSAATKNVIDITWIGDMNFYSGQASKTAAITLNGDENEVNLTLIPTAPYGSVNANYGLNVVSGRNNTVNVKYAGQYASERNFHDCPDDGISNSINFALGRRAGQNWTRVVRDNNGFMSLIITNTVNGGGSAPFAVAETITGATSGSKAVIVSTSVSGANTTVNLAQDGTTGFGVFTSGEVINGGTSLASGNAGTQKFSQHFQDVVHSRGRSVSGDNTTAAKTFLFKLPQPGIYDVSFEVADNSLSDRQIVSYLIAYGRNNNGFASAQIIGAAVSVTPNNRFTGTPSLTVDVRGVVTASYTKSGTFNEVRGYGWTLKNPLLS